MPLLPGATSLAPGAIRDGRHALPPAPASLPRLQLLTFLRFGAALWILIFHLQHRLLLAWPGPLLPLVLNGAYAMSFFFVLSGVVLTYGYFDLGADGRRPTDGIARFFAARFARIYPAYAVTHLLCLPWLGIPLPLEWERWLFVNTTSALGIQAWFPHAYVGANAGTWSISCEFFFYALFPALLPLMRTLATPRNFPRAVLYLCLLIGFLGLADYAFAREDTFPIYYTSPFVRLPEFVLGMLVGAVLRMRPQQRSSWWSVAAAAMSVLLVSLNTVHRIGLWTRANLIVLPAIAWLLYATARYELSNDGVARHRGWRLMRYLGEVSYCFFLVQMPLLLCYDAAAARDPALTNWVKTSPWLAGGIAGIVVLLASAALHESVEKPARRILLRRWFGADAATRLPSAAAAA